ncbi:hypothetical protein [Streptomyces tubercidicus]|uniref:hypothetical protein n=1 Tax=Streptomyces tubercidicus TaxID=47759 RepID=UPI00368E950A
MPYDITIGLAGHAPNTAANVTALLEDFLHLGTPDSEGYYAQPTRWENVSIYLMLTDGTVPSGLEHAARLAASIDGAELHLVTDEVSTSIKAWAECCDSVSEVADPLEYLVHRLDSAHGVLCVAWDETDADDTELISLAHSRDHVTVRNLVQGLVEIVPGDEDPPDQPAAPEEAKAETPARRRRTSPPVSSGTDLDETPQEVEEQPPPDELTHEEPQAATASTLEEDVAQARRARDAQTTIAVGAIAVDAAVLAELARVVDRAAFYMRAVDATNAAKNLAAETVPSPLAEALGNQVQVINSLLYPELAYEDTFPKAEKKRASGKRHKVVLDEESGKWQKAGRGRTRAGVKTGWMGDDGIVHDTAN